MQYKVLVNTDYKTMHFCTVVPAPLCALVSLQACKMELLKKPEALTPASSRNRVSLRTDCAVIQNSMVCALLAPLDPVGLV